TVVKSALESVARWSARLREEEESANALASLIEKAEVSENGIRVSVRVPLERNSQSANATSSFLYIRRQVPIELRRRGVEMRLVIGGEVDPKVDLAILKMVARSHQWLVELLAGSSRSLAEIAERAGLGKRYVNRIMRLAFLAPSIIEEIARGHQPPQLTAQALSTRRGDLPLSWHRQRELLGFAPA